MKSPYARAFIACTAGVALSLGLLTAPATAAEPRTWISLDGRTLEAELLRRLGADVELRDTEGRVFKVALAALSFGDQDYVNEFAPEDKSKSLTPLGGGNAKPKLPNPAREAKIDSKLFKKEAGTFPVNNHTYSVCETPHFKILYIKPMDPTDVAELAERLWLDTAFFHSTFAHKWKDRKMAVMLVNDQQAYDYVGEWYAGLIKDTGNIDASNKLRATWPRSAAGVVNMPANMADHNSVFPRMRVFRAFETPTSASGSSRPNLIKGVWIPFRTHCLASDMLELQAGGISGIGADGSFAIFNGHAYYKEILLTGKSETSLLRAVGTNNDVSDVGGFKEARTWAAELKKRVKKGEAKTDLNALFKKDTDSADEVTTVLAYSFARFLQSSQEKLASFNKLCERISTSNQIPEPAEIAKFYGFEDAAALEKAWSEYILSSEFR
jgi:hypothetical protein